MIVLDINRRLNPENRESHLNFPFSVDKIAKALIINFSFYPDLMEDQEKAVQMVKDGFMKYYGEVDEDKINNYLPIKNLLTLSIDSPKKSLGTAHRHLKIQQHKITSEKASRGFIPSEIMAGQWNITISVHSIATDYVDIKLSAEVLYD